MDGPLFARLAQNTSDIVFKHFATKPENHVMIIYDTQCELSRNLKEAYEKALHSHVKKSFVDFDSHPVEEIEACAGSLHVNDVVILIQSLSFRVSVYRWRLELFDKGLKVGEHVRLSQILAHEIPNYVSCLTYDYLHTQPLSQKLEKLLNETSHIKVECQKGSVLEFTSRMEKPVINLGDFDTGKVKGGYFPVGEIFSEAKDIEQVNGRVEVFAFPGEDHQMVFTPKPFVVEIKNGYVEDGVFPEEFQPLVQMMRTENPDGKIPVREFGLGLNRGLSKEKRLTEATAWERVAGLHLSLGWKHGAYLKKFKAQKELNQRYHVDIYPDVKRMWISDTLIYENGKFVI
ncbi:MAG: hypothetical protein FJY86_04330 [Candidatus Diapherotrites archaeon]|uniref:Uncharacterized protein n=1 Tax=Candidatus Iainarchaeum sp. TaxID=3101447 RepID=A0A8T4CBN1_9ARCH|nr:hypothetical protein [Candidatus Diapherotrites archaeon]